jgi:hypothetical protein
MFRRRSADAGGAVARAAVEPPAEDGRSTGVSASGDANSAEDDGGDETDGVNANECAESPGDCRRAESADDAELNEWSDDLAAADELDDKEDADADEKDARGKGDAWPRARSAFAERDAEPGETSRQTGDGGATRLGAAEYGPPGAVALGLAEWRGDKKANERSRARGVDDPMAAAAAADEGDGGPALRAVCGEDAMPAGSVDWRTDD